MSKKKRQELEFRSELSAQAQPMCLESNLFVQYKCVTLFQIRTFPIKFSPDWVVFSRKSNTLSMESGRTEAEIGTEHNFRELCNFNLYLSFNCLRFEITFFKNIYEFPTAGH
jgi:hypothetical protein